MKQKSAVTASQAPADVKSRREITMQGWAHDRRIAYIRERVLKIHRKIWWS